MPPFRQPAGHDPDHPLVPATICQHDRRILFRIELFLGLLRGRELQAPFLRIALGVEFVKVVGQRGSPRRVVRDEQLDAVGGRGHPAGGVEPGAELERDVLALDPRSRSEPRELDQPGQAGAATGAEVFKAVLYEQPVLVDQRHDVGDRSKGRQADRPQERLPEPGRHAGGAARPRGDRPRQFEGHAGPAEAAEWIGRVWEAGVHEHVGRGQGGGEVMVVGDDQLQPEVAGMLRLRDRRDPAVDRDHEAHALRRQRRERLGVEAVALFLPARHVPRGLGVERLQAADEDRGGAHAVGIVVAVDRDLPAGLGGSQDPLGGLGHAGEGFGVAEVGERAVEKRLDGGGIGDAPGHEQASDDTRHAGGSLESRHGGVVVRTDVPALRHRESLPRLG